MYERLRAHINEITGLTDEEFEFIRSHFSYRKFRKHQFLIQEGENVKYAYFVLSGLLKLVYTEASAKQHIIAFAMEDWWESDFLAFFTQSKATMSLECIEDTEVLCITAEDYQRLRAGLHKMEHFLLEKANFGYIASQQRIMSLLTSNAKERYDQLLKRYPSLIQRVPKTHLASYLGVSRETLSRLTQ